jgi:hypothetical protein
MLKLEFIVKWKKSGFSTALLIVFVHIQIRADGMQML